MNAKYVASLKNHQLAILAEELNNQVDDLSNNMNIVKTEIAKRTVELNKEHDEIMAEIQNIVL
jgi:outer membrane murein-binding lipoprotein Lpp